MPVIFFTPGTVPADRGVWCRKLSNPEETILAESGVCPDGWVPTFSVTTTADAPRCDVVCILAILAAAYILSR